MAEASHSVVEIFDGPHEGHRCGYCKSANGSLSYGMWSHSLTVHDYKTLIDRGWRRSGKYCYKPCMKKTCCPLYTIKCDTSAFQLSKSQKKVLRRMHRFLNYGNTKEETEHNLGDTQGDDSTGGLFCSIDASHVLQRAALAEAGKEDKQVDTTVKSDHCILPNKDGAVRLIDETRSKAECSSRSGILGKQTSDTKADCAAKTLPSEKPTPSTNTQLGKGANPNKPPCKKAKILRRERKLQKLVKSQAPVIDNSTAQENKNVKKTLYDYLSEPLVENPAHNLEIRLVRRDPSCQEFQQTFEESYELYKKYQMTIHNDPPHKCTDTQFIRFLVDSPLEMKLVRRHSADFHSSFQESFHLYSIYQMNIHDESEDECDIDTYLGFLVDSPLEAISNAERRVDHGSFHHQYWLDGKLIAVGVIDILPFCVSAVYFYYDPKYSFLSLGTYGALREIALVQQLNEMDTNLQYYYMGYYTHSCPKMRYKGQYAPSMLLCPEAYTWCPLEEACSKIDKSKYSRLENLDIDDKDADVDLEEVTVLYKRTSMPFGKYRSYKRTISDKELGEVMRYAKLVGKNCARSLLLYRK